MANWCQNIAHLIAPDEDDATDFIGWAANEELNEEFGVVGRYMPTIGGAGINYIKRDGNRVEVASHSRNEPPVELYRAMEARGWKVDAVYWEPENCFWGCYRDGTDDQQEYDIDEDGDWLAQLPAEIVEHFRPAISEFAPGWTVMTLFN